MQIVEVGPRDGLQNEATVLSTEAKVEYITRLIDAGLRRIEAVAFAHPARVPQLADAEAVLAAVPRRPDVSYSGLVLNPRGLDRALAAGVDEINYVVVATDEFSIRNQGMTTADSLRGWQGIAERARAAGLRTTVTIAAAFGCPFTGEVAVATVRAIAEQAAFAGPDEVCIADTIGVGVPRQVRELLATVREVAPTARPRFHFHNTRNTGYANAAQAAALGVDVLDASTGGIGGCPFAPAATGNIATEDLAYLLEREGLKLGLDLAGLAATGTWIGDQLGKAEVPAQLGRAGLFP